MQDGSKGRFEGVIGVASGWIVVFLAVIAASFVLRNMQLGMTLRILWYVLVAVAVLRAAQRTWRFWKTRRARA